MGCPHAERCPLFPLLRASLRSWREYYCDTGDGWRDCARYTLSLTGAVVPITLLPNGAHAQHLKGSTAEVDPAGPDPSTPPRWPGPDPRRAAPPPSGYFEQAAPPTGLPRHPLFPQVAQTPGSTPAVPPQPRRRWWTRLTDWISGPA
ncbi:hypothetical protein O7626_19005 [Micromonospora sp. WMMD1102]|uniref:hypothetical protein n=1 Tax=Micromonospora sp. WMMD1102 TaxID=3016105 RepID=UPI00241500C5|nr:hypothetical protein [Micromonospora sp. WMMD1102]MDG4788002.1 hypothetical protein [Micromonospora sp. WMMD1102]